MDGAMMVEHRGPVYRCVFKFGFTWKPNLNESHRQQDKLMELGGGFKYFLMFTPKIGEDDPILTVRIFFKGVGSTTN